MTNDSSKAEAMREAFEAWWAANETWPVSVKNVALLAWTNALATSASALARDEASVGLTEDARNLVTLDRRDLWDHMRGAIHAALHDKIPKNCVVSWAWEEATNRTMDIFQKIVDTAPASPAASSAATKHCEYCDGTGDVHGIDGEWRGECTACDAASSAATVSDAQIIEYGRSFPPLLEVLTREPARVAFVQCQRALLATSQAATTAGAQDDDEAVDRFAVAMKEKMAAARAKGRSGWQECSPLMLSEMLRAHVFI